MVKLAARYADTWITEGNFRELWSKDATAADVLRLTRERSELLRQEATSQGRDPSTIRSAVLAGYSPGLQAPWASPDAFSDLVGRYREIGLSVFVLPEPRAEEIFVFERIALDVIPTLRSSASTPHG